MRKPVQRDEWVGCIDPPGPWAPISEQRKFIQSLDAMPECDQVRMLRELALMFIQGMEEHPGWREPNDLN